MRKIYCTTTEHGGAIKIFEGGKEIFFFFTQVNQVLSPDHENTLKQLLETFSSLVIPVLCPKDAVLGPFSPSIYDQKK